MEEEEEEERRKRRSEEGGKKRRGGGRGGEGEKKYTWILIHLSLTSLISKYPLPFRIYLISSSACKCSILNFAIIER